MPDETPKDLTWAEIYSKPLPSPRTGIFYNTFPYPTKISPETVAICIAAHTNPGDMVLDTFGGSGSTGLAALMCEHPTPAMRRLASSLGFSPTWGARNAVIYEIGKYGAFAAKVMANPPDFREFSKAAAKLVKEASEEFGGVYDVPDPFGGIGTIRHVIWSDIVQCPSCGHELAWIDGMVQRHPLAINGRGLCPSCGHEGKSADFKHKLETIQDPVLGCEVKRRARTPAVIYGRTGSVNWRREATPEDARNFGEAGYPAGAAPKKINWCELWRGGYHCGITHLHHFYTPRNFRVFSHLWERSASLPASLGDAVRLLLLSYNAAHATLMTRVVVKKGSKDFVLTGAQSGVLYISSLPVEKNLFSGIIRKSLCFQEAFKYLSKCSGRIEVLNSSSRHLAQADKAIDYAFTDPPFGDFIPYAEVNQINELWLGVPTDRGEEIVISRASNKGIEIYRRMMADVFREIGRVLKDGAKATIVFHASKAAVWEALRAAVSDAGFHVEAAASLEKTQASFKQVVSYGSVRGDPLVLLTKDQASPPQSASSSKPLLREAAAETASRNEKKIYSKYVEKCLESGMPVEYDARAAYDYVARLEDASL